MKMQHIRKVGERAFQRVAVEVALHSSPVPRTCMAWGKALAMPAALALTLGFPFRGLMGQGVPPPLTLSEAVERALALHPGVGRARASREGAAAGLALARSTLVPAVSAQGWLNRFQEPMVVAPLHGFDPRRPPAFHRTLVQGALFLGYTFFDGGERRGRIEEARAGLAWAEDNLRREVMDAAVETASAYLEVLALTEVREAALRHVEALDAEETRVAALLQEGKAARVELLRAGSALAAARAEEVRATAEVELAWARLARRTGWESEGLQKRGLTPVPSPRTPLPCADSLLARAGEENPEFAEARREVEAARAYLEAVRGVWLPRLEGGAQLQSFGTWEGGHSQEWQMGLRLSYPLFTGGGRAAEVARARSRLLQGEEKLRLVQWRLEEGLEEARAQAETARARREAMEGAVRQAEEVARIEALALAEGAGVQSDLLRAHAELFQARARLAEARLGELLARVRLARLVGDSVETLLIEGRS